MRGQTIPVFYEEKSASSTQYMRILQGIRSAANRCCAHMELVSQENPRDMDFDAMPPVVIVTGASMPLIQSTIALLREHGRRAVLAGTDSEQFGHDVSCATPSRRTETQQLVNYLYRCGRKSIALVGFGENSINDAFRLHAAMSAVAAWGRFLTGGDVYQWHKDPQESFAGFLPKARQYDTVICPNDITAICFMNECKRRGLEIPRDLFVASFGNASVGRFYRPSLTSMTMDMLCVGEQAFQVWRFLMDSGGGPQAALKITVPSRILVRESTAGQPLRPGGVPDQPALREDLFYEHPTISVLVRLEKCISQCDEIDMRIIAGIMQGDSYEQIADSLFISASTLRYRLNRIFANADVSRRGMFEALVREHLGEGNPFALQE